jgi:outer membrane immunogenic protein
VKLSKISLALLAASLLSTASFAIGARGAAALGNAARTQSSVAQSAGENASNQMNAAQEVAADETVEKSNAASATTTTAVTTAPGNYKGAAPCPTPPKLYDGFYLGAQLGYDSWNVKYNSGTNYTGAAATTNPTLNATGVSGGVLFGYGRGIGQTLYLGIEAFYNGSSAATSYTTNVTVGPATLNRKYSVGGSFGIDALPGVKLNDQALLYLRLGWTRANLKGQETATVAGVTSNASNMLWQNGWTYGTGIEARVYENWSLRGEYNYTAFSSFKDTFGSRFSPANNQVMMALIYHFI